MFANVYAWVLWMAGWRKVWQAFWIATATLNVLVTIVDFSWWRLILSLCACWFAYEKF